MALFGKNKSGDDAGGGGDSAGGSGGGFSPEKARVFFDRAKTTHDTINYPYAAQLWLNGLAQDPSSVEGFEGFWNSISAYLADVGEKKANSKEIAKGLSGQGQILKYQQALLNWGLKPTNGQATVKAAEASASLGLTEITQILGQRAMIFARQEQKPKKDVWVKLFDIFDQANAFDLAVEAGQTAMNLDPSDGELATRVKSMLASAAIKRGKFEETKGEVGGFRKNIRDAERQANLEAEDAIVKTGDVKDRIVSVKKAEYDKRPDDVPTIEAYGRALLDRGKPLDEVNALLLFKKSYEATGQFRFRQRQGEVELRIERRKIRTLKAKLAQKPDDAALASQLEAAEEAMLAKQIEELRVQVENYPTNMGVKFELGKLLHEKGEHNEAIGLFQKAEEDPQHRKAVLRYKAEAFNAIGWADEAIDTYRAALSGTTDEAGEIALELRYGLLCALQAKAEKDRDISAAEEGDRIASQIAMKRFDYRDIVERRQSIKDLIKELRA